MSSQFKNQSATFSYSTKGDGSVRVRHREYIGDVLASTSNFEIRKLPINPGIGDVFIWLQSIALCYESYVFNSLSFEYESTSSTTDRGAVLMAIDFDAVDSPPGTKQELMSFHGSVRSNVWAHTCCSASPQDLRKFGVQRYVRGEEPLPQNSDIKTYDVGNFYIAHQGVQTSQTLGELYVTYDITLHTPQPSTGAGIYSRSALIVTTGSPTPTAPLPGLDVRGGMIVAERNHTSMSIKEIGTYLGYVSFTGTGVEDSDAFSIQCPYGGSIVYQSGWHANGTNTVSSNTFVLNITSTDAYIQINAAAATSLSQVTFRFAPYPLSLAV